ncbi:type II secretion system protein GspC [Aliiglaciecola sp. LCG003]|uniref:type II secretion system protein GspC n=1 Tax=Aliiglaciecola sp. LCG003 TaxID=3053655 RepID=UPI0025728CD1|nr:type II secretion system protein GspC [Aliiglaciecola sp. LCG003]WJG09294.1 type II secretion system protein GspC [Aliiglaciecola sp. LCG003]
MTVGSTNLSHIWLQISKYQSQLSLVVVILLVLYLLAFLADMTWRLIPSPQSSFAQSTQTNTNLPQKKTDNGRINLAQLKSLNLFGDLTATPEEVKEEVTDAPETKLNLTLTGVVASDDANISAAIIQNKGLQNTYGIEDEIDGTNATLHEVYADRVIIKNGPRRETLMLDGIEYGSEKPVFQPPMTSIADGETIDKEEYKLLSPEIAESTRELQRSPTSFMDYIQITPHTPNGQLVGYRIAPGKNPILFKGAGFVAGDIVTEINGLDLTDPQQALEAMAELSEAQALQLTINRGEELLTLYLDFPAEEDNEQDI